MLQDNVPGFPFKSAKRIVEEDLGKPLEDLYDSFSEVPLAAASLGQVCTRLRLLWLLPSLCCYPCCGCCCCRGCCVHCAWSLLSTAVLLLGMFSVVFSVICLPCCCCVPPTVVSGWFFPKSVWVSMLTKPSPCIYGVPSVSPHFRLLFLHDRCMWPR